MFRELSRLEEVASMLCNLPIKEFRLIGQYYKGLHARRMGQNVSGVFEKVAEESRTYKARALMSLAAIEGRKGNYDGEHDYFTEALKTADNPSLIVEVSRCIAVVKAKEGFHPQSLKDLEKTSPLLRYANSHVRCQYYNSCAVELCEVGRLEEARNLSNIVLASPYVFAYPEWRETADDIALKAYRQSRSSVAVPREVVIQDNIVRLPERASIPTFQDEPGRVLYPDWESMVKKDKNGDKDPEIPKDASIADMMIMVMNLMSKEGNATEEKCVSY